MSDIAIEAFNQITKMKKLMETIKPCDLSLTEVLTIQIISEKPDITITEIAKKVGVSKAAISQLVAKLEKKGFVKRKINLKNRQTLILLLSENVKEKFEIEKNKLITLFEKLEEKMGEEKINLLRNLMAELLIELEDLTNEVKAC